MSDNVSESQAVCWYPECRVPLFWRPRKHYGGEWVDSSGVAVTPTGHVHGAPLLPALPPLLHDD